MTQQGVRDGDGSSPAAARESPHSDSSLLALDDQLVLWLRATPHSTLDRAQWADVLALVRKARTRIEVAGGLLMPASGASIGASFDPLELTDAIELTLGLLADAKLEGIETSCALALGGFDDTGSTPLGAVIDRAQHLAHHAVAGELLLDEDAARQAESTHLFVRSVQVGTLHAQVVDARFPTKRECRSALAHLRSAPLPESALPEHARLRALLEQPGVVRIAITALHPHAALDRLSRLRRELTDGFLLHASRDAAGLMPLGALTVALRRAAPRLAALALDPTLTATLERMKQGAAVRREEAVVALRALFARVREDGLRPLIVLDRARELDLPSLATFEEALSEPLEPHVVVATLDEGASVPSVLSRGRSFEPVAVEPLDEEARLAVAASVLGLEPGDAVARYVAELGGDSIAGIEEAARMLVSSGDVVFDERALRFRTQQAPALLALPLDALVARRAGGLPPAALRALEAACIAPLAADRARITALAELDGLRPEAAAAGLEQLEREDLLRPQSELQPLELITRHAVRTSMPPSRAAELHRFVAQLLLPDAPAATRSFQRALLAHHLAEGGRENDAALALLDGAEAASDSGFERVAVRLAALALKLDASSQIRQRASALAARAGGRLASDPLRQTQPGLQLISTSLPPVPGPAGSPEPAVADEPAAAPLVQTARKAAITALCARDAESAERMLDTAVAAGLARAAAGRLSAIAQLAKGDVSEAVRALKRVRAVRPSGREALTAALILLEAQAPIDAVRSALEALASARRVLDRAGELAALHVLAACYRVLDREPDAGRLEAHALALAASPA